MMTDIQSNVVSSSRYRRTDGRQCRYGTQEAMVVAEEEGLLLFL